MESNLDDMVRRLSEVVNDHGGVAGERNIVQYYNLSLLIYEKDFKDRFDLDSLGVTERWLRGRLLRRVFSNIDDDQDPVASYHKLSNELEVEIKNGMKEFTVYFCLPTKSIHRDVFSRFNLEIAHVDIDEWIKRIEMLENKGENGSINLNKIREKYGGEIINEEFSCWQAETLRAHDPSYAIQHLKRLIEVLLGQILFSGFRNEVKLIQGGGYGFLRPFSDLKRPRAYILEHVRSNSGIIWADDDFTNRLSVEFSEGTLSKIQEIFPKIPSFEDGDASKVEHLSTAFRRYFKGLTTVDNDIRFFNLWKSMECLLAPTSELSPSDLSSLTEHYVAKGDDYISDRVEKLHHKRNLYIHNPSEPSILEDDIAYLKNVIDRLLLIWVQKFDDFNLDEFDYFTRLLGSEPGSIDDIRKDKEGKLRVLDEIESFSWW